MKILTKIKEWVSHVGQDRTLNESLAVFCLVSCGGWSALTIYYILLGMPSILALILFGGISLSNGWLGMWFLTKMKREVKDD